MNSCIFCKIVSKEIPVNYIYEDEHAVAFADLHPVNPGHTLVIPRTHSEVFLNMEVGDFSNLMALVHRVGKKVDAAFPSPKLGVLIKGFDVPHTHVHLIPLQDPTDLTVLKFQGEMPPQATAEELARVTERIRAA